MGGCCCNAESGFGWKLELGVSQNNVLPKALFLFCPHALGVPIPASIYAYLSRGSVRASIRPANGLALF